MRLGTVEYKSKAVEITALWQSLAAFSSKFPIAQVLVGASVESSHAQQRSEDAIIATQGALIVSRGLRDCAPFQRVIQQLPQQLCRIDRKDDHPDDGFDPDEL